MSMQWCKKMFRSVWGGGGWEWPATNLGRSGGMLLQEILDFHILEQFWCILSTCYEKRDYIFMVVWNKTNFYRDNVQLAFYKINVAVSILVSVYKHQHGVDTPTVHYYCILHTRLQATYDNTKSQMVPFLTAGYKLNTMILETSLYL